MKGESSSPFPNKKKIFSSSQPFQNRRKTNYVSSSSSTTQVKKKASAASDDGFTDTVFSWSFDDVFNHDLYTNKVKKIPGSFRSVEDYLESYDNPLFEETRAELHSSMEMMHRAPFAEVISFEEALLNGKKLYQVRVSSWRNVSSNGGRESYKTIPGDIFVLANSKPENVKDLQREGMSWTFLSLVDHQGGVNTTQFKVKASKGFKHETMKQQSSSLYVIFLVNVMPQIRIWEALHMSPNLKMINEVLCNSGAKIQCDGCSELSNGFWDEKWKENNLCSELNESQSIAVFSCLHMIDCKNKSSVQLIGGPPGTGKTTTTSTVLVNLLRMNCKTLVCTPTNVAISEVASCLLRLVLDAEGNDLFCSLGGILLFGATEKLNINSHIQEMYLDYRVQKLGECFGSFGWKKWFPSMINLLENSVSQYHSFLQNELTEERGESNVTRVEKKGKVKSFLEYMRETFDSTSSELKRYISIICRHTAKSYISEKNFQDMVSLDRSLVTFESSLLQENVESEVLEELFSHPEVTQYESHSYADEIYLFLFQERSECLSLLRDLYNSLNRLDISCFKDKHAIKNFCFERALLILCTVSNSSRLQKLAVNPTILVIDEAAQLKECESLIPLQLPSLKHAILVGDEWQLPATVKSRVCEEADFGRSLFKRLLLNNFSKKHLLNRQYRMHRSISAFPNSKFYNDKIINEDRVERQDYLSGPMFGPYSFINVTVGREEKEDDGQRQKNMIQVAVILKILQKLFKAWVETKEKLNIGVVCPYTAQIDAIQENLRGMYDKFDGFHVKVKTVDGFQGGEEDIIIMSTVCCSSDNHSSDFKSEPRRINVALTRARNCLWILGDERSLADDQLVWQPILINAKSRGCFFNAEDDEDLAKALIQFRNSKWKVFFSDNFLKSLTAIGTNKSVRKLLVKLSEGCRPREHIVVACESSLPVKIFEVEGLCVVTTVDILQGDFGYVQVLKIWDLLPYDDTPRLIEFIDRIFVKYKKDFINLCNEIRFEGKLEVPKSWPSYLDIVNFKDLSMEKGGSNLDGAVSDQRGYDKNSKLNESSLPMKFYSMSSCVANHILSDRDGRELDLPFKVLDLEREIINCSTSTFVQGRSGTGKTTVLTMKLLQKEYFHHMTMEGFYGVKTNAFGPVNRNCGAQNNSAEAQGSGLRQLFVTATPTLCKSVEQHISNLRSSCSAHHPAERTLIDMVDIDKEESRLKNIPDSFQDIPHDSYPLVVTFHKFLMMLDGTLSKSYFEGLIDMTEFSLSHMPCSRSRIIESFIRTKEVNYERFSSQYWPHFDSKLTKKLDSSTVFTEIICRIKGSLQAMKASDGKLTWEDYLKFAKGGPSGLSRNKRQTIYQIFWSYEKQKMENGEFDLADFVNGLHNQLRDERYKGDEMHFVYIDEVQDLTMSQLALFKHVCGNVEEGFVFSGDDLRSATDGMDFKIQDIQSLFDKKIIINSTGRSEDREDKGKITKSFHLTRNYCSYSGISKLSQSILELCYHFFPLSTEMIEYETSKVNGGAPVLLECRSSKNAIITLFGRSKNASRNANIGFGAEQVILVRDEDTRKEIKDYVGKQALILTIPECKDKFQDVLLYNFFGSSPLGEQWKVICNYTKEQDMNLVFGSVPVSMSPTFPLFDISKHYIMLHELKQLYIAVSCTKQRLWICDSTELSKPMFDYWIKKCLVQVKQLDDSFVFSMQVPSSKQEWKSRGIKLYYEHNYEMASICFEKSFDIYWERKSKASGLKAMANRICSSKSQEANSLLREAAKIFIALDETDSAARCFYDLGEYERAGNIYFKSCDESELQRAGECYTLARCYELAVKAYARGKLYSMGLACIERWKQHAKKEGDMNTKAEEIEKIEQEFLERCARNCYEVKDNRSMINYLKSFKSMTLVRNFLRPLGCYDELMLLEKHSGNFMEAAEIAKLKGDVLAAIDLLEKAGKFNEAATLILSYVLANSLWSSGKKGWPLKFFKQKDHLLTKAKSFAKNVTQDFYEFVLTEAEIMTNEKTDLAKKKNQMIDSRSKESVRGEILSSRKILDAHLASSKLAEYVWEEDLVHDLMKHSEDLISKNQISVESLVYFWNFWKDKIVRIFEYLECLQSHNVDEFKSYGEFCLSFLGVLKQSQNQHTNFVLLNTDAAWARNVEIRSVWSNGKLVSIDVFEFVSAAKNYWSSEVLSVGFMVLHKLEVIHKFVTEKSHPVFRKCRTLSLIYEVVQFLLESKFLKRTRHELENLRKLKRLSTDSFSAHIFPLDWRKSLVENHISFRGTYFCKNFLKQVTVEHVVSSNLSYRELGNVAMFILVSGKLNDELFQKILRMVEWNRPWKEFFETLHTCKGSYNPNLSLLRRLRRLHDALKDAYNAHCRGVYDCISIGCFLYLLECFVTLLSSFESCFIATKSSFVEWLVYQDVHTTNKSSSNTWICSRQHRLELLQFVIHAIKHCLHNKEFMTEWIKRSVLVENESYSLLVQRMVAIICLIYANFEICLDLLLDLRGRSYITEQLPRQFCETLKSSFQNSNLDKAFMQIDNNLVIVSFREKSSKYSFPNAVLVNMEAYHHKNDIIRLLFTKTFDTSEDLTLAQPSVTEACDSCTETVSTSSSTTGMSSELSHSSFELATDHDSHTWNKPDCNPPMDVVCFWEIFERINSDVSGIGEDNVEKCIRFLTATILAQNTCLFEEKSLSVADMINDLKQFSAALDSRNINVVKKLSKRLQSEKPRVKLVLSQLYSQPTTDLDNMALKKACVDSDDQDHVKEQIGTMPEKIGIADKGKLKVSEASSTSSTESKVLKTSRESKVSEASSSSSNTGFKISESKVPPVQGKKEKSGCYIQ
ncbi:hypothetical protein CsatB_027319 [Cannabis sativa]